ncbi:MAG TPA: ABC transporter permease [Candidatus Angelobacter sp.]
MQDVRLALRMLWKSPGFSAIAIFALALGIGGNSTVYSSLQAMVLRPLAFKNLDRILVVSETLPRLGWDNLSVAPANYRDLREHNVVFEQMAALLGRGWDANLTGVGTPQRLEGYQVTASFFPLLNMPPLFGRTFTDSEAESGSIQQAVISYGAWQKHFAADPGVIGRTVTLNGSQATVIGVMPSEFDFPLGTEIWAPLATSAPEMNTRGDHTLMVLGRLKPHASMRQARAALDTLASNLEHQYPATNSGRGFGVSLLRKQVIGETRHYVIVLMWAAVFVLLLACANVANLQLARGLDRQRELAVRVALGAPRWRIARQVLVESLMLSLAGGLAGLLLASWAIPANRTRVPAFILQHIAGVKNIRLDGGVLAFTAMVAILTGVIAGLIPAGSASFSADVHEALKEGARGSSSSPVRRHFRSMLVVTEVALALVLLVGAGLMVKGFNNLLNHYPGYEAGSTLSMQITLPDNKYADPRARADFYQRAVQALTVLPAVEGATAVKFLPSGWAWQSGSFTIEGAPPRPGELQTAGVQPVTPDFFATLRIPLRQGRLLSPQDGPDSPPVAVLTDAMARRYFPRGDALGHRIRFKSDGPWHTIVGVVGDIRQGTFDDVFRSTAYVPIVQSPPLSAGFILRTARDPISLAPAARAAIQSVDPDQPVYDFRTLQELISDNSSGVEYVARMMLAFGVIALLLAAAGIYAVMACVVSQRTHEIGIRMALGARHPSVLRMIMGHAARLAASGLVIGMIASFALSSVLARLLVGVVHIDVLMLLGLTIVLTLIALLAGYVPARRATRVDPIIALRRE